MRTPARPEPTPTLAGPAPGGPRTREPPPEASPQTAVEEAGLPPLGDLHLTRVRGTDVAWAERGDGPPLVLLHGVGDSHRTWRRAAPLLADHFRLLMPDLPGHGLSGRPDAPYTLDWFSDVIDAWMRAIGVPRAHFCGHSYGGGLAQWMVLHHRRRVDRLALVASGGLGHEVALGLRLAAIRFAEVLCTPATMRLGSRLAVRLDPLTFGYPEPAEVEEMARLNARPGSGHAFARTVRDVIDPFGQHRRMCREVGRVRTLPPVALFWGEDDRILPAEHGRMAAARFEGATLTTFPGCGHFPHLQEPVRFAEELRAYLLDPQRPAAQVRFACPGAPRTGRADDLPEARCTNCTFRGRGGFGLWPLG